MSSPDHHPELEELVAFAAAAWGPVPRIAEATAQEVGIRLHAAGYRDAALAEAKLAVIAEAERRRHAELGERARQAAEAKAEGWRRWRERRRDG